MKYSTTISAYIPVVLPGLMEGKEIFRNFEHALDELISLLKNIKITFTNGFEILPNIRLAKDINKLNLYKYIWEGSPSPFWNFWFLDIKVIFKYSRDGINKAFQHDNLSFSQKKDCYIFFASEEVAKILNDILLAVSLAKCGLITTNRGIVLYKNKSKASDINGTHNLFHEARLYSDKYGWPHITELELQKTWYWLNTFSFFANSIGEGPIGRAIASLTYLLKDECIDVIESINLDVIWILIGLEALYGKGNTGLKSQIIEKSHALLGKPNEANRRIAKSYDLRSRVIHGDIDIPFNYCMYEGHAKYEKISTDLEDARLAILSLLLATIQKLIIDGITNLDFEYTLLKNK